MRIELKPCPFCGGEPYLERKHRAFIGGQTTKVALVRCTACNARSGRFELRDYGCSSSCEQACYDAAVAWNTRPTDEDCAAAKLKEEGRDTV